MKESLIHSLFQWLQASSADRHPTERLGQLADCKQKGKWMQLSDCRSECERFVANRNLLPSTGITSPFQNEFHTWINESAANSWIRFGQQSDREQTADIRSTSTNRQQSVRQHDDQSNAECLWIHHPATTNRRSVR